MLPISRAQSSALRIAPNSIIGIKWNSVAKPAIKRLLMHLPSVRQYLAEKRDLARALDAALAERSELGFEIHSLKRRLDDYRALSESFDAERAAWTRQRAELIATTTRLQDELMKLQAYGPDGKAMPADFRTGSG